MQVDSNENPSHRYGGDSSFFSAPYGSINQTKEEKALLTWISTFSKSTKGIDLEINKNDWTRCDKFSSNLLKITKEVYDKKLTTPVSMPSDEDTAKENYANVLELIRTGDSQVHPAKDKFISILSSLLCFAVSEQCENRNIYINRIMNLDQTVQVTLMKIIQPTHSQNSANEVATTSPSRNQDYHSKSKGNTYLDDIDDDDDDDDSLLLDDSFDEDVIGMDLNKENMHFDHIGGNSRTSYVHNTKETKHIGPSPRRTPLAKRENNSNYYQRSPMSSSHKGLKKSVGFPSVRENNQSFEREIEESKKKHLELLNELSLSHQRESDLSEALEETNSKNLAERLKIESEFLRREAELREQVERDKRSFEGRITQLQQQLNESQDAKEQLVALQDEIDVLKHASEKLQFTEEQLRKHKIKLGVLSDAKEALAREEEAHSAAISKCLALENELSALQPLRRQLEDYKTRTVQAEVKLAESESNFSQLKEENEKLSFLNKNLEKGAQLREKENEGMRRQLLQDDEEGLHSGVAVGDGISELNPIIKEELLRLRNENERLNVFAEKRGHDAVQRMEEKLEDTNRLANQFKDQYIVTKRKLEETVVCKEKLEDDLNSTKSKLERTEDFLKNTQAELNDTQANLSDTRVSLSKTQESEEILREKLKSTEQVLSTTENELSGTQQKLLETHGKLTMTEQVLEKTKKSLHDSQQRESKMKEDLSNTKTSLDEKGNALKINEKELEITMNDLIDTKKSLDVTKHLLEESRVNENRLVEVLEETKMELSATQENLNQKTKELENTKNLLSSCEENLSKTIQERDEKDSDLKGKNEALETTKLSLQVTNESLEETKASLQQSLERETLNIKQLNEMKEEINQTSTKLQGKVQELEKTLNVVNGLEKKVETTDAMLVKLKNTIKEERLSSQKAAIEAERKLQNTKRSLTDDARSELDEVEKKMKLEFDEERKRFREKLDRITLDMNNSETKSSTIISNLRQDYSAKLRESREDHQNTIQNIENDHRSKLKSLAEEASVERKNLVEKGKQMIKDVKLDYKKKLRDLVESYEEKLSEKEEEMSKFLDEQANYENKAKNLLSNYKRKIHFIEEQQNDTSIKYDKLHDEMTKVKRENVSLKGDNDRMRKQIVGRYGSGSNATNELSTLQKEFKNLLEENSRLKQKQSSAIGFSSYLDSSSSHLPISDAINDMNLSQSYTGGDRDTSATKSSTMALLRAEYEEKIENLNDEKRQLIMRCSAAASEAQRSEQKVWELETKIEKQNSEITTLKLNLKRTERHVTEPDKRPTKRHSCENPNYSVINESNHPKNKTDFLSNTGFTETKGSVNLDQITQKNAEHIISQSSSTHYPSSQNQMEESAVPSDNIGDHLKMNSIEDKTLRNSLNSNSSSGSQNSQKRKASLIESTMPTTSSINEGKQECTQS